MDKPIKHHHIHKLEDMNIYTDLGSSFDPMQSNQASITIHVAPKNSAIYDSQGDKTEHRSNWGHTFMSIRGLNPLTDKYEQISIGFSPGDDWGTSADNISFNDHVIYKDASTLSITSQNAQFYQNFDSLFTLMHNYKTNNIQAPNYNPLSFSGDKTCGKFIQSILEDAGIDGINIPLLPNEVYEQLKHLADNYQTPLVIDLNGNGIQTLADSFGVSFDFLGRGTQSQTGWVHPDDGLLVWDKNNDGLINHGDELFGNNSLLSNNTKAKDGFIALSEFDSNMDNVIDKTDSLWHELKIWQDKNSDGISQFNELATLGSMDIKSLELNAKDTNFYDGNGNFHKLTTKVNWNDGKQTNITDVLFHQKNTLSIPSNLQHTLDKLIDNISNFTQQDNVNISLIPLSFTNMNHNNVLLAENYL